MTVSLDDAGALAHELKTPLAVIIGYADAMRERAFGPLDEKYIEGARTIEAAARHLQALVEALTGGGRPRLRFDARAGVAEATGLFDMRLQEAGIALAAELGANPVTILADPLTLRQIVINLLANALAATPAGGRVALSLARDEGDLVIALADTGPGISGMEGQGLGLVRALAASHGGRLDFTSRTGGGVVATVRLPILVDA
ncbi:MAG TPA: ATP-binding protein [Caulobacteraceae bacterium]|nr:ATP-binding protein [Caulobacteraceae bacterium]